MREKQMAKELLERFGNEIARAFEDGFIAGLTTITTVLTDLTEKGASTADLLQSLKEIASNPEPFLRGR